MEVLAQLIGGLANIFTPVNLMVMVIGLVLGMLVAVLPGLTLVMGVVLALPFTYKMGVEPALILLTAMYVSGTYGGAITAILFRIPGEPMDVPLLWDGYAMTRKGQAAKALGYSLVAALVGGLVSAVVMVALSKPVASVALSFSSPEFFAITVFGLVSVVALGGGSMVNALISLCLGLLIATVGVDAMYGAERFAFGINFLQDGIEFLLVMVGAYGIGEVLSRLQTGFASEAKEGADLGARFKTAFPKLAELLGIKGAFIRGTPPASLSAWCRGRVRRSRLSSPTASRASTARTPSNWAAALRPASSPPRVRHRVGRRRAGAAADHGHSRQRCHRDHPGGLPAARHPARSAGVRLQRRTDLHRVRRGVRGGDRHVRARLLRHQAAVQGARCARGDRVRLRRGVLLHRRLCRPQQSVRPVRDRDLRAGGLPVRAVQVPDRAAGARHHPRPAHREQLHDNHGELQQRLDGAVHAADQRLDPGAGDPGPVLSDAARRWRARAPASRWRCR